MRRSPMRLPSGSVRAMLTLMVMSVVIVEAIRGRQIALLWTETLLIALAHYFTSRRFVNLPPDIVRRLQDDGHLEKESHPLYLPRHTIRGVIVCAFLGLAVYLYATERILQPESLAILVTVFAYLIGVLGRSGLQWWMKGREMGRVWWWDDLNAIVVLLVMAFTCGAFLMDRPDLVPRPLRLAALGLVLFYFGSR